MDYRLPLVSLITRFVVLQTYRKSRRTSKDMSDLGTSNRCSRTDKLRYSGDSSMQNR